LSQAMMFHVGINNSEPDFEARVTNSE